ncbi:MAG: helix-turn-helix domain-containing protein [Limisphaerales bacterium]
MKQRSEINQKNFKRVLLDKGMTVTALAEKAGCSRLTVYRAVKSPTTYSKAYKRIIEVLNA